MIAVVAVAIAAGLATVMANMHVPDLLNIGLSTGFGAGLWGGFVLGRSEYVRVRR